MLPARRIPATWSCRCGSRQPRQRFRLPAALPWAMTLRLPRSIPRSPGPASARARLFPPPAGGGGGTSAHTPRPAMFHVEPGRRRSEGMSPTASDPRLGEAPGGSALRRASPGAPVPQSRLGGRWAPRVPMRDCAAAGGFCAAPLPAVFHVEHQVRCCNGLRRTSVRDVPMCGRVGARATRPRSTWNTPGGRGARSVAGRTAPHRGNRGTCASAIAAAPRRPTAPPGAAVRCTDPRALKIH
jgi:hypothetical protein